MSKDYLEVLVDETMIGLRIAVMEHLDFPHTQSDVYHKAIDNCVEFIAPSKDTIKATHDYLGDE